MFGYGPLLLFNNTNPVTITYVDLLTRKPVFLCFSFPFFSFSFFSLFFFLPASPLVPDLVVYGAGVRTVYQRPRVPSLPLPLALAPPLTDLGAGPPRPGNGLPLGGHSVESKVMGSHFPI